MPIFIAIFRGEFKRFIRKRNLMVWLILLLVTFLFLNNGINRYKKLPVKTQNFNRIQDYHFKKVRNYDDYVTLGIKVIFESSPLSILFRNVTVPPDVTAQLDSIVRMQITNNMKGNSLHTNFNLGYFDFSRVVLFLFCLAALWYGLETLGSRDFILSLDTSQSTLETVTVIGLSRFIMLLIAFLMYAGCVLLFITARGVAFSSVDYWGFSYYLLVTAGLLLFFFIIGLLIGTVSSARIATASLFIVLFISAYIIPVLLGSFTMDRFPDAGEDYRTEADKFAIVSAFESSAEEKYGKFYKGNIENERKIIEGYKKDELLKIVDRERELLTWLERASRSTNRLGLFFPVTFYLVTCNELSGNGYESFLEFYRYSIKLRLDFVYFWIDRVFYHNPENLVNFLKNDEYIFHSSSRLPIHFSWGLWIMLGYIVIFAGIFYFRFKKWLYPSPKSADIYRGFKAEYSFNKVYALALQKEEYMDQFINAFYGVGEKLDWEIRINGKNIVGQGKQDFFLVPNIYKIPGEMQVKQLLLVYMTLFKVPHEKQNEILAKWVNKKLNQRYHKLEDKEKIDLILNLALLIDKPVLIFKNFGGNTRKLLKKQFREYFLSLPTDSRLLIFMENEVEHWLLMPGVIYFMICKEEDKYIRPMMLN